MDSMGKLVPMVVYFGAQRYMTEENLGEGLFSEFFLSWFPFVAAFVVWTGMSQMSSRNAETKASEIVGQEAPDFTLKTKEGEITLKDFVAKKKLPTVLDFYQNF
ncbi:unnamed protein product [Polarella glacialis]|uniref:Uncharacterized protein n=1 Tax=Polarella glacialis TaxID=89957 RepID=A0A813GPS4_POLGL|nr:unnamed protein product [Polarella glacialis]|mmetsp:Transcript_2165/g.3264  ORF Transcript_2165/g.3264 Transcript_2165/m.3264 type:complete len:104 (-) Transcript_2165:320-631(-)